MKKSYDGLEKMMPILGSLIIKPKNQGFDKAEKNALYGLNIRKLKQLHKNRLLIAKLNLLHSINYFENFIIEHDNFLYILNDFLYLKQLLEDIQ